jgi:hypothetical protein
MENDAPTDFGCAFEVNTAIRDKAVTSVVFNIALCLL